MNDWKILNTMKVVYSTGLYILNGGLNMKKTWFILLLVIAVLLSGCTTTTTTRPAEPTPVTTMPAPTQTPEPTTPATVSVAIKSSTFTPDIVEISKGTTVIWTNDDGVRHTVTSISDAFDSGNIDPGKTYSYTFNQAGPFEYRCSIHPSMPHGKVIVT
jgi:plastocyanin